MTRFEMENALAEIDILERRQGRLIERARFVKRANPNRAEHYYKWADVCADEIGRRKDELWIANGAAVHEAAARKELPL